MSLSPVRRCSEFERIAALPRRPEISDEQWSATARAWSLAYLNDTGRAELARIESLPKHLQVEEFARHGKAGRPLLMRVIQAKILLEAVACGGVFASASVGAGKTLVSWLLPLVLGASRPVLFVPASLVRKTHEEFEQISTFWKAARPTPHVVSYELLGQPDHVDIICGCMKCTRAPVDVESGLKPDLMIFDESDLLRNSTSARTRRVSRYIANHFQEVRAAFMTGTPLRKSLRNFAPQLIWALRLGAPVPLPWHTLQEWCEALDEDRRGARRPPGALLDLAEKPERTQLDTARTGFRSRLLTTPGIVTSDSQSCDQPLTIRMLAAPHDPELDEAFRIFRETEATLDDWDIDDPLSALRYGTELGCGFYYRWDPRPPKLWLAARRAASIFVREEIKKSQRSGRPLDTKAMVYRAYPNAAPLRAWRDIEQTFVPKTEPVPVAASVLGAAASWMKENGPALIWVSHKYVGDALSAMSGVPYFGPQGKDSSGRYIMEHAPEKSAIVSLFANKRGRNLQAWHRNLVLGPPSAATEWEQAILGRTHRQGQTQPVHADVLVSCAENLRAISKAFAEAEWCQQTGGHTQKLLIAEYDWSAFESDRLDLPLTHPGRPRWTLPE
jgi:hypothetical protein